MGKYLNLSLLSASLMGGEQSDTFRVKKCHFSDVKVSIFQVAVKGGNSYISHWNAKLPFYCILVCFLFA